MTYNFTTLIDPNSPNFTEALGINANGTEIAGFGLSDTTSIDFGWYTLNQGLSYTDKLFSFGGTEFTGVNDGGLIIGWNQMTNGTTTFIFDPSTGSHPLLTSPLGTLMAEGINDSNEIVGRVFDSSGQQHGFLDVGGTFTQIDDPNALAFGGSTIASGINNAGQIVGSYVDGAGAHGFLDTNGVFITIDDPLATGGTIANGINSSGEIVGSYNNGSGVHGFTLIDGVYTTVDAPNTVAGDTTVLTGVDDNGDLVGWFRDASGAIFGFEALNENPNVPANANAQMVTDSTAGGSMRVYDLDTSDGTMTSFQLQDSFHFAGNETEIGMGHFNATDTADVLGRTSDGTWFLHETSGNNSVADVNLGVLGNDQVLGTGNFSGHANETDVITRSANGVMTETDIVNGTVTGTHTVGTVSANWQPFGAGDFNGDGTTDLVLKNARNGQLQVETIQNGVETNSTTIGKFAAWDFWGAGQFDATKGADMLLHNSTTGALEIVSMNSKGNGETSVGVASITPSSINLGQDWSPAGVVQGSGGSADVILHNNATGALEDLHVVNDQITMATQLGALVQPSVEHVDGAVAADHTAFAGVHSNFFHV